MATKLASGRWQAISAEDLANAIAQVRGLPEQHPEALEIARQVYDPNRFFNEQEINALFDINTAYKQVLQRPADKSGLMSGLDQALREGTTNTVQKTVDRLKLSPEYANLQLKGQTDTTATDVGTTNPDFKPPSEPSQPPAQDMLGDLRELLDEFKGTLPQGVTKEDLDAILAKQPKSLTADDVTKLLESRDAAAGKPLSLGDITSMFETLFKEKGGPSLGDIQSLLDARIGQLNIPTLPSADELASSFVTQFGRTQGEVARDVIQAQLGALPTLRAEAQKDIETFYPGFMESRLQLGDLATQLSTALAQGTSLTPASRQQLIQDVRSAQGVRGLSASPDQVVQESLALRAFDEQARTRALGDVAGIFGMPLPQTPTTVAAPQFGQVASLGLGLGGLDVAQGQLGLQSFQAQQEPLYFQQGMELARQNQPRQPGFFDFLGGALGAGLQGLGAGLGSGLVRV